MSRSDSSHGGRLTAAPRRPPSEEEVPRLSRGIELIGRYEDSGFKEPPCIARREDGQMVQMPPMLFSLAELVDGRRDVDALASSFSDAIERAVEPDMVRSLLDEQLRPLGVVAPADGEEVELRRADPLDALRFRVKVIPAGVVRSITTVFRPLFFPPIVAAVALAFAAHRSGCSGSTGWARESAPSSTTRRCCSSSSGA